MKQKLLFMLCWVVAFSMKAQETTVDLSMGERYANQVYYKLDTEKATSFAKNIWDIAFLRNNDFNVGMYVNDADGVKAFEASSNPNDWDNITIEDESKWKKLYNSDVTRETGAFMGASGSFGWGNYNQSTHVVEGSIIFVLKYSDGTYKKFFCESYSRGYNFKYASWDAKEKKWTEVKNVTLSNTKNNGYSYNFYSLRNNQEIIASPKTSDWDFVFTKYYADYKIPGGATVKYPVTGVLQNGNVAVAKATGDDTSGLDYSEKMNSIGYNWKTFTKGQYIIHSDKKFYIKYADGTIYKMYFTKFDGGSTGNLSFKFENVTNALSIEDLGETISFGVYPNPVGADREISLVYDVKLTNENTNTVEIFNVRGQKVFQRTVTNNKGFYNNKINLQDLNAGVYILKFTSGSYQKTRKIVLN